MKEDAGKDFRGAVPPGEPGVLSSEVGMLHGVSETFWGFSDVLEQCY